MKKAINPWRSHPEWEVHSGFMLIYMAALPIADGNETLGRQVLSWGLTLVAIGLTYLLVHRCEPKVFPEAKRFSLKLPNPTTGLGLLLLIVITNMMKCQGEMEDTGEKEFCT